MRRTLLALHKYAGLTLGLLLALIGLSGSLLVFDHALDERLAPQTVAFEPGSGRASYSEVLAAARAAVPGHPQPSRVQVARGPGSPHIVRFPTPAGAPGPLEVSVAPTDARVLAVRGWGAYTMSWIYRLHYTLLAGKSGETIVGFMGLLLIFFCLSGLLLWWPRPSRRGNRWRRALTVKPDGNRFRFYFDLHKVAGVYALPVLLVIAVSGVSLVFPQPFNTAVGWLLPVTRPAAWPPSTPSGAAPLDPDQAVAIGRQVFPAGELKRIYLPRNASDSYGLSFRQPGEPWRNYAASFVRLDQYSGTVLARRDITDESAGNRFLAWQFPLHNGDAFGLAGRWLVLVAGLAPALLCITGIYLWWRKRRPAGRRQAPQTQTV